MDPVMLPFGSPGKAFSRAAASWENRKPRDFKEMSCLAFWVIRSRFVMGRYPRQLLKGPLVGGLAPSNGWFGVSGKDFACGKGESLTKTPNQPLEVASRPTRGPFKSCRGYR